MDAVRRRQKAVGAKICELEEVQEALERGSHVACRWAAFLTFLLLLFFCINFLY